MQSRFNQNVKDYTILGAPATMAGPPRRHSMGILARSSRILGLLRPLLISFIFMSIVYYRFADRPGNHGGHKALAFRPAVQLMEASSRQDVSEHKSSQQMPLYQAPGAKQVTTEQPQAPESPFDQPRIEKSPVPDVPAVEVTEVEVTEVEVTEVEVSEVEETEVEETEVEETEVEEPEAEEAEVEEAAPPEAPPVTPIKGDKAHWQDYSFLQRYFGGLRTVVNDSKAQPEYPHHGQHPQVTVSPTNYPAHPEKSVLPELKAENPYLEHASQSGLAKPCYLDEDDSKPVPKIQAYSGKVQGFPDPIMGSYEVLGTDGNKCYDRHGRFGPYGYGYSKTHGGINAGIRDEREGVENDQYIDYSKIHWGKAQERCYQKNKHRYNTSENAVSRKSPSTQQRVPRSAVMLRIWHKFEWTQELILHMRSMISELSLLSGGEYQIYFLIHVKDNTLPIWSSDGVYESVLNATLPEEFRGMGVLWSEKQMELVYNGLQETRVLNRGIFGVFRSAHFPLQYFAHQHPEIEYFWNWEIDIRYTGHWYTLFDSLRSFARKQPRKGLWERNERFYIPSVHGTWQEFVSHVENATSSQTAIRPLIWGPHPSSETTALPSDPHPPRSYADDRYEWGVDEEADLITLSPLFDPSNSGWAFRNDVTGYKVRSETLPPRRTSIITASRLSRRLLSAMHTETIESRHTMFDEMWPATVALHHGLKGVYAPHPMYIDRAWPIATVQQTFNGGPNGVSGSSTDSPFYMFNEHNFRGVTWYYNAVFASTLYRRWWGFTVDNQGGVQSEIQNEGRMCLPPMLLHPIKGFELVKKE